MRALIIAACWSLLASGCFKKIECTTHGGDPWVSATTQHFRVRTSLGTAEARAYGQRAEELRAAMLAVSAFGSDDPVSPLIELVVVSRHEHLVEFHDFSPCAMNGRPLILVSDEDERARAQGARFVRALPTSSLAHQLAHRLFAEALLGSPRWMTEGHAQYLDTIVPAKETSSASVGAGGSARVANAADGLLPLAGLWAWNTPGRMISSNFDAGDQPRHYGSSWAWMHFLMGTRLDETARWLRTVRGFEDPRESFGRLISREEAALMSELLTYVGRQSLPTRSVPVEYPRFEVVLSPMTDAAVHRMRASLWSAPVPYGTAYAPRIRQEIANAKALETQQPLEPLAVGGADAVVEAERWVAREPTNGRAWWLLAKNHRWRDEKWNHEEVKRALELDPDNAEALNVVAWRLATSGGDPAAARATALRAVKLEPSDPAVRDTLAAAFAAAGECNAAYRTQLQAIALLNGHQPDDWRATFEQRARDYRGDCKAKVPAAGADWGGSP